MNQADVDYHRRRADQHRKQAENCPADIKLFHKKLAELHDQRADDLESGKLTHDDELLLAGDQLSAGRSP